MALVGLVTLLASLDVFIIEIACTMRRVFGLRPRTQCVFGGAQALFRGSCHEKALVVGERQVPVTADEPAYVAFGYALLSQGKGVFPILTQRSLPSLPIALEVMPAYLADPLAT